MPCLRNLGKYTDTKYKLHVLWNGAKSFWFSFVSSLLKRSLSGARKKPPKNKGCTCCLGSSWVWIFISVIPFYVIVPKFFFLKWITNSLGLVGHSRGIVLFAEQRLVKSNQENFILSSKTVMIKCHSYSININVIFTHKFPLPTWSSLSLGVTLPTWLKNIPDSSSRRSPTGGRGRAQPSSRGSDLRGAGEKPLGLEQHERCGAPVKRADSSTFQHFLMERPYENHSFSCFYSNRGKVCKPVG